MVGSIFTFILFVLVVMACCASDSDSSSSSTAKKGNTYTPSRKTSSYHSYDYCECPSCGAPYYDGYCEECGYPDVNLGWVGENY